MITKGMFTSQSGEWETPQDLFDSLDAEFGFTLDACAVAGNAKCRVFYSPRQDGLKQVWRGVVWCNPPYGRQIGRWVGKGVRVVPRRRDGRDVAAGAHGHRVVSRLHLRTRGNPFPARSREIWKRRQGSQLRAVSQHDCSFPRLTCNCINKSTASRCIKETRANLTR